MDKAVPPQFLRERAQMSFVVRDLTPAVASWTKAMKVGPFIVIDGGRVVLYRGRETAVRFSPVSAYIGDVQIELAHPLNR